MGGSTGEFRDAPGGVVKASLRSSAIRNSQFARTRLIDPTRSGELRRGAPTSVTEPFRVAFLKGRGLTNCGLETGGWWLVTFPTLRPTLLGVV